MPRSKLKKLGAKMDRLAKSFGKVFDGEAQRPPRPSCERLRTLNGLLWDTQTRILFELRHQGRCTVCRRRLSDPGRCFACEETGHQEVA